MSIYYNGKGFELQPADISIKEESSINWCDMDIRFTPTPGHSEASMCFAIGNYLFTGDTIIKGEKTVTKLPGGRREEWKNSITKLQKKYEKEDPILCCGHGENWKFSEIDIDLLAY